VRNREAEGSRIIGRPDKAAGPVSEPLVQRKFPKAGRLRQNASSSAVLASRDLFLIRLTAPYDPETMLK